MKKVLVTYASKFGATAEIAEKIHEILIEKGMDADIQPVNTVQTLDDYQSVVLGSAVYYGRWKKEAVRFLTKFEKVLKDKETWFFSSGPLGEGDPVELLEGWTFPPLQQEVADRIQPNGVQVFHGVLEEDNRNFFEKWILKKMASPTGDFRDWDLISTWADSIARILSEK